MANVQLKSGNDEWCTPEWLADAIADAFGGIGLDPCSNVGSVVKSAAAWIGLDALAASWHRNATGLVYVNPPYSQMRAGRWTHKILLEAANGAEVLVLVPARTDSAWWQGLWKECTAVCLLRGRLTFKGAPNPAPFPSCLFYFGPRLHVFNHMVAREELGIVSYGKRWGFVHAREADE